MYIENENNYTLVSGTSSADTIHNNGHHVTIQTGKGNDSISSTAFADYSRTSISLANYSLIDAGDGNDDIDNFGNDHCTVYGGNGNDSIINTGNYSTIFGGAGNDILRNDASGWDGNYSDYSNYSVLNSGAGNDYIVSGYGQYNTLIGGTGNDTIDLQEDSSRNVIQYTVGDGNDIIYGFSSTDTFNSTGNGLSYASTIKSGSDTIIKYDRASITFKNYTFIPYNKISVDISNTIVSGTSDDDSICNYSSYVTIRGGYGNDTLVGSNATMYGDIFQFGNHDDYDLITNYETNDTIHLTGTSYLNSSNYYSVGNDRVISLASDGIVTIKGGAKKNIKVKLSNASMATIYGGNDKLITGNSKSDSIYNTKSNVSINVLEGNDTVSNYGNYVTIDGGAGNDSIHSHGNYSSINSGDGNDIIHNCISTNNNYVSKNSTINAGSGKDFIYSRGANAIINGDSGNDTLWIYNTSSISAVDGGDGDDQIISAATRSTLNGGTGNDSIENYASQVTIIGGKGNDTIRLGSNAQNNVIVYDSGDGNDTIYGYNSSSKISINGSSYSTQRSGNDLIYNVGSGSVRIVNSSDTGSKVTQQEVIKKFMKSLDTTNYSGIAALNQAVSVASDGYFSNVYSAINQMVADCRNASNATTFLKNYCGIDLSNKDTGAIIGYDAGGSTVLTAEGVVPETGSLDTSFNLTSFTSNGVTFRLYNINVSNDELYIWRALKTWWADESFKLIKNSYNYSFTDSDAQVKNITVKFVEDNSRDGNYLASMSYPQFVNGITTRILTINKAYYYNFNNSDVNGESPEGQSYLDRTIAHELTHALMMSKVNSFSTLPQFITEGTAELVHGVDDNRNSTISSLAKNASLLQKSLNLIPGTGGDYEYASGYMFLRYLAKQSADHSIASNFYGNAANDNLENDITIKSAFLTIGEKFSGKNLDLNSYSSITKVDATKTSKGIMIIGNQKANSISAGTGDDTISGNTGNDKIFGGKGNDIIAGDAGNDSINGGAGNDTLAGGDGNDTLTGGAGKDIFIHNANNELITDYKAGEDKIKLAAEGATITSSSTSGSDVILTINDTDKITVKGGNNQKITVIDSKGKETTKIYSKSKGDTLSAGLTYNTAKTTLTVGTAYSEKAIDLSKYASTVKTVDASKFTKSIKITGNSSANSIKGGKGADTLIGGKGNDTLTGGSGNDVFSYANGDGKDIITDYTAKQDKIKLTSGSISSSSLKGSDVVLKIGSGSITLKNAKGKSITVIDSNNKSTSKVYGTSSKNYIEKLWFETDDNFTTDEINAITQQNVISNDKLNNATGQLINYDTDNILLNNQQITSSLVYNCKK